MFRPTRQYDLVSSLQLGSKSEGVGSSVMVAQVVAVRLRIDRAPHPTKMDVGRYNLNLGQANLHLDRYPAATGPGGKYDPLYPSHRTRQR
jgi:hypothetical protein